MNSKLHEQWILSEGFFNNSILYCEAEYSIDKQLEILQIIWEYLTINLHLTTLLFYLNDWHNHDGYISKEETIDKNAFKNMLTNTKEILKNRNHNVYDLIYNEAETFMLRWYCEVENKNEVYCDFTLILSNSRDLQKVKKIICKNVFSEGVKIKNTKQYFDKLYAG